MSEIITTSSKREQLGGLHYTTAHTGKMQGLQSLSTSVTVNPFCLKRVNNGASICSKCFAAAMMKRYKTLDAALVSNAKILTSQVLPFSVLPLIPVKYFRFEAFGDIINAAQVVNYFNIAKKNPETLCALWTKNPQIIAQAIELGHAKPSNLQIVLSSPIINQPLRAVTSSKYSFIDKIFTVYDKQHAANVEINCGARSCLGCGRCYRPNPEGVKIQFVNELLK